MRYFNKTNHAKNLPDTYRKDVNSNNYKILETERDACEVLRDTLNDVYGILDLDNATGETLDMYGERIGQSRGNTTDEQYIVLIKAKIMRNLANGSYKGVCNAVCATFGCEQSALKFEESTDPCTIKAKVFPVKEINAAGFTASQALAIIKSLLPVCVTLETIVVDGTFEFADSEGVIDNNAGFTDVEGGTIGGTFGTVYGGEGSELPI